MRRRTRSVLAAASLLFGGLAAAPFAHAQPAAAAAARDDDGAPAVWTARITADQVPLLLAAGVDGQELAERPQGTKAASVELYLTPGQARDLRARGIGLTEKRIPERTRKRLKAAGDGVFRPYSGKNGLQQELLDTAKAHPGLTKVVSIGKTVRGQDILALKLSKDARTEADGRKPAVLYMSNQHAREWITPEMTRRLLHHYLDGYGKDARLTDVVDRAELWFVLSANPDGYDYTFQSPATRLWRKNLRDNNGDGKITPGDGVDLNRNFPYKWGYDNEGSSPRPGSETYRGPAPASEPETRALDAFEKKHRFGYAVNYHSAAELLLYGVGWQVATPTPDDVLYKALAGTPEKSAIPGYRPQVSSELYTTNGEADGHAANVNGTMMFTPEMSTCRTASEADPHDRWDPADCPSSFSFPDDEKLIQQEFAKNIPFALSVAETAVNREGADRPRSSVGLTAPDFTPDAFTTSYALGDEQEVSVTARKSLRELRLNYRIDGGRTHSAPLKAWKGGDRYGGRDSIRFAEYRGYVEGAEPGSSVRVWYTGRTADGRPTASEPFTYAVAHRPEADTLVIADEGGTTAARHAAVYTGALAAAGRDAAVWDVATRGAPHALGVLGHFKSVLWYSGDNRPGGATLLAVRDFVNEGGKLIAAGKQAGGYAVVGAAETNDFSQYYLGAGSRAAQPAPARFTGTGALAGTAVRLGDAPGDRVDGAGTYTPVSDELPPAGFPQFRSAAAGEYTNGATGAPCTGTVVTLRDGACAATADVRRAAAVSTPATVLLGFGLQHVPDPAERSALISAALRSVKG